MTTMLTDETYGTLTEPATLTLQRLLPGPIERVWLEVVRVGAEAMYRVEPHCFVVDQLGDAVRVQVVVAALQA